MAVSEALHAEPLTDEALIERTGHGDQEAFEILYERYFPRVYRFVSRRLSNRSDVEETVQEVFINVFSSLDSYRREAPFGAWVLGVSRRTVASEIKTRLSGGSGAQAENRMQTRPEKATRECNHQERRLPIQLQSFG